MKSKRWIPVILMAILLGSTGGVFGYTIPDSAYINHFNGHPQAHNLSCEARSAADLAGYWGLSVGEEDVLTRLPSSENPNAGFVGSVDDAWGYIPPSSYGVHAEPIASALQGLGVSAEAHTGMSMDELRREIAHDRPVIVWIIGQMWEGKADLIEMPDQQQVLVASYEHTMIITGYDSQTVQVFDPYYGVYETFDLPTFQRSWAVLGNMAVTAKGLHEPSQTAALTPTDMDLVEQSDGSVMYTVQYGDYLIELGERFGVDWRWLVEINQIPYPWTLFPGQVIRVK